MAGFEVSTYGRFWVSTEGFFLWGYPEQLPHGLSLSEGEAMLRNYHARGFILGTYVERWEEVIMNIVTGG